MSNTLDFLDALLLVLEGKNKSQKSAYDALAMEDHITDGKYIKPQENGDLKELEKSEEERGFTEEEQRLYDKDVRKAKMREYMQEYLKTYIQPETKKRGRPRKKRKNVLEKSKKIRKKAESIGLKINKNGYIIDPKNKKRCIDEIMREIYKSKN